MWRRIFYAFCVIICAILIGATLYLKKTLTDLPSIYSLDTYTPSLITKLYDRKNRLISELFTERRALIPIGELPADLQNALIAIEDELFFSHWGISIRGIMRAFIINAFAGKVRQGGSTITQQLTKVLFLTRERTITRKIKELVLALQLEHNFSKKEILQMYLNQIYFGKGAYGIQSAAKLYFGKRVSELTLSECAMLAGLPRAPNYYSPLNNPWQAYSRRRVVLSRMRQLGFITQEQEIAANKVPLITEQVPLMSKDAPYFVEHIRRKLEPIYGSNALYQGGLSIYTTLDLDMQKSAEDELQKFLNAFDKKKEKQLTALFFADDKPLGDPETLPYVAISTHTLRVEGALVSLDPRTGAVRAMIGGRDFKRSQFNRITQALRQPGSTFKPFVWTVALREGLTPGTTIEDLPLAFYNDAADWRLIENATDAFTIHVATSVFDADTVWVPRNWDTKYLGSVTVRKGLELSRNLVSVRLIDHVGPVKVARLARSMGIYSRLDPVLSLGLGTSVVTPLEITSAFGTYANEGVHAVPFTIVKITDHQGRILEEHIPNETALLDPQTNFLMINMMKGVIDRGTGMRARALGAPAAGKTGTSQDYRDLWFIGFTPHLITGVWMGYDDFHPLGDRRAPAGSVVPLWTNAMKRMTAGFPSSDFRVPQNIIFAKIDADTGALALASCPQVILEAFIRGTEPVEFCRTDHTQSNTAATKPPRPDESHDE